MTDLIDKVKLFATKKMASNKDSSHNIEHVLRVYKNAMLLSENEPVDLELIKIAALLHDIGGKKELKDSSGNVDHATESAKMAKPFLKELGLPSTKIKHILDCIVSHRFRTTNVPQTLEAKIVFDADKLETIGAIGVARCFSWVGKNNAHIYKKVDIDQYAKENLSGHPKGRIQDKSKHSPQINWETKDKFILDYLYTNKAKKIAKKRKKFSEIFFDELERELKGSL